jgi:hypothetical protein
MYRNAVVLFQSTCVIKAFYDGEVASSYWRLEKYSSIVVFCCIDLCLRLEQPLYDVEVASFRRLRQ